ncbi:hypothetical protein GCM10020000_73050 [Streptomyces olivoverticillatus]
MAADSSCRSAPSSAPGAARPDTGAPRRPSVWNTVSTALRVSPGGRSAANVNCQRPGGRPLSPGTCSPTTMLRSPSPRATAAAWLRSAARSAGSTKPASGSAGGIARADAEQLCPGVVQPPYRPFAVEERHRQGQPLEEGAQQLLLLAAGAPAGAGAADQFLVARPQVVGRVAQLDQRGFQRPCQPVRGQAPDGLQLRDPAAEVREVFAEFVPPALCHGANLAPAAALPLCLRFLVPARGAGAPHGRYGRVADRGPVHGRRPAR